MSNPERNEEDLIEITKFPLYHTHEDGTQELFKTPQGLEGHYHGPDELINLEDTYNEFLWAARDYNRKFYVYDPQMRWFHPWYSNPTLPMQLQAKQHFRRKFESKSIDLGLGKTPEVIC